MCLKAINRRIASPQNTTSTQLGFPQPNILFIIFLFRYLSCWEYLIREVYEKVFRKEREANFIVSRRLYSFHFVCHRFSGILFQIALRISVSSVV